MTPFQNLTMLANSNETPHVSRAFAHFVLAEHEGMQCARPAQPVTAFQWELADDLAMMLVKFERHFGDSQEPGKSVREKAEKAMRMLGFDGPSPFQLEEP